MISRLCGKGSDCLRCDIVDEPHLPHSNIRQVIHPWRSEIHRLHAGINIVDEQDHGTDRWSTRRCGLLRRGSVSLTTALASHCFFFFSAIETGLCCHASGSCCCPLGPARCLSLKVQRFSTRRVNWTRSDHGTIGYTDVRLH